MRKAADPGDQLQETRKLAANKKCFDCGHSGTTYVITELGIFVCSICAGLHREFSHRAKGLSMSNFSQAEVDKLINTGNDKAAKNWMARHNPRTHPIPDVKDLSRLKEFMRQKYIEKRFYEETREEEKEQNNWAQFENQKTEVRPVITPTLDNIRPPQKPQNLLDMDEPPAAKPFIQSPPTVQLTSIQPSPKPVPNLFPAPTDHLNGHTLHTDSSESVHSNLFPVLAPPNPSVSAQPQYSPTYPPAMTASQFPTATSPTLPNTGFFPSGMQNPYNMPTSPAKPVGNIMYNPAGGYSGINYPQVSNISNVPSYMSNSPMAVSTLDPFDSIIEEERMKKLYEQQEKARKMSSNQNILMQQYLVQAQLYQQTYGVPYPYSFQQWYSVMHPSSSQLPSNIPHPSPLIPQTQSAAHHHFTSLSDLGSSQSSSTYQDTFGSVKPNQKSNNPFDMFG